MEQSFLAYLRGRCRSLPQVDVGIGDDAAVFAPPPGDLVVCTDQIIDGVDFRSEELDESDDGLANVGYKSVAINLSDLAAMGARPHSILVTLSLPRDDATRIAGDVYEGILEIASEFQLAIAGGDISTYDGPLAISVTAVGSVPPGSAWRRGGAEEGDAIFVTGAFGGSLLGRHLRPRPRLDVAAALRKVCPVHAAIDVSDGLSLDLDRMLAASRLGAELDVDAIPIHSDAETMASRSERSAWEHAWSDGEDFELIFAVAEENADRVAGLDLDVPITRIGTVVGRTGLWQRTASKVRRLSPQGYEHKSGSGDQRVTDETGTDQG